MLNTEKYKELIRNYSLNDMCISKWQWFSRVYKIWWPHNKQLSSSLTFPTSHFFFTLEKLEESSSTQSCKIRCNALRDSKKSGKTWNLRQVYTVCTPTLFINNVSAILLYKLNPAVSQKDWKNFNIFRNFIAS